ncbi:hypothetical protein K458DRAFT_487147 [Lentithecium fluviatile CBS 122367]|uniref:Uncharacterized protein n=1 Tax=Lentithecium fluviatile CBS 122367 TaxID=1168545 RepID=A0A6G1J2Y9_9PLEO|nr:hypothetical protein K458DRAFT_487147 [Lentithecium fluviatile CBS 122367]
MLRLQTSFSYHEGGLSKQRRLSVAFHLASSHSPTLLFCANLSRLGPLVYPPQPPRPRYGVVSAGHCLTKPCDNAETSEDPATRAATLFFGSRAKVFRVVCPKAAKTENSEMDVFDFLQQERAEDAKEYGVFEFLPLKSPPLRSRASPWERFVLDPPTQMARSVRRRCRQLGPERRKMRVSSHKFPVAIAAGHTNRARTRYFLRSRLLTKLLWSEQLQSCQQITTICHRFRGTMLPHSGRRLESCFHAPPFAPSDSDDALWEQEAPNQVLRPSASSVKRHLQVQVGRGINTTVE